MGPGEIAAAAEDHDALLLSIAERWNSTPEFTPQDWDDCDSCLTLHGVRIYKDAPIHAINTSWNDAGFWSTRCWHSGLETDPPHIKKYCTEYHAAINRGMQWLMRARFDRTRTKAGECGASAPPAQSGPPTGFMEDVDVERRMEEDSIAAAAGAEAGAEVGNVATEPPPRARGGHRKGPRKCAPKQKQPCRRRQDSRQAESLPRPPLRAHAPARGPLRPPRPVRRLGRVDLQLLHRAGTQMVGLAHTTMAATGSPDTDTNMWHDITGDAVVAISTITATVGSAFNAERWRPVTAL